jgi:hypothetical protein
VKRTSRGALGGASSVRRKVLSATGRSRMSRNTNRPAQRLRTRPLERDARPRPGDREVELPAQPLRELPCGRPIRARRRSITAAGRGRHAGLVGQGAVARRRRRPRVGRGTGFPHAATAVTVASDSAASVTKGAEGRPSSDRPAPRRARPRYLAGRVAPCSEATSVQAVRASTCRMRVAGGERSAPVGRAMDARIARAR